MGLKKLSKMRLFQQITGWSVDKIRANKKQVNALLNDESISFTEQELTEEQKAQARTNIGAGTYSKPSNGIPTSDLVDNKKLDLIDAGVVGSVIEIRSGSRLVGYNIIQKFISATTGKIETQEINLSDLYTIKGVSYVIQSLTEQQKAQARTNINAGDAETVQGLDEKVNGSTTTEWVVLEAETTLNKKCLSDLAISSTTSIANYPGGFIVKKFRVENGNTVRITAKKPGITFMEKATDFFAYSSSLEGNSCDRVANGEAKESTSAGEITNFEFLCSSDGYLVVVGDNSTPPKCELLSAQHTPGIEERVTDLEQKVGEDTLDELLSTLGTTLNGTFEKVWDDVNKKYTFTFTPGT